MREEAYVRGLVLAAVLGLIGLPACLSHTVKMEPIEVKPIKVTMDINLRMEKAVEDFFSFEDEFEEPDGAGEKGGE